MWFIVFFFFKQKTAYEMRISDWSSDVCSSDLLRRDQDREQQHDRPDEIVLLLDRERPVVLHRGGGDVLGEVVDRAFGEAPVHEVEIGRASCRERVCQYV